MRRVEYWKIVEFMKEYQGKLVELNILISCCYSSINTTLLSYNARYYIVDIGNRYTELSFANNFRTLPFQF